MKNPPEVAIIVPTYNEERNIGDLLESVQAQTLASEVAVVDQQSTDRTVDIARAYGCVVVARPRPAFYSPPGQSRNYGVAATSARLLLHLDADMRLPAPDFLARLVRLIDDTHQAAVIHELDVASGFWGKCKALERRCYWHTSLESARAVTRTLFTAVGGYDAQISSGEDLYIARLYRRATTVVSDDDLVLIHSPGRQPLGSLLKKKYRYGKTASRYLSRASGDGGDAALQIVLASLRAYLQHPAFLLRDPLHYIGIFPLRLMELIAVRLGMIAGGRPSEPA